MDFRNRQKGLAENWFRERGVSVEKTHRYIACDPKDNFIDSKECPYSDFLKKIQRNKSLRGPRNGISSQAMLANLFGHCQREDFVRIICRLKFKNIEIQNPKCEFECDAGKWIGEGGKGQTTRIDACIYGGNFESPDCDSNRILVEMKYCEENFGTCKTANRACYRPILDDLGIFHPNWYQTGYQFYRSICAIKDGGYFVLLYHAENAKILSHWNACYPTLPLHIQRRVQCLSVQEILSLLTSPNGEKRWISEFKTRYGLN